MASARLQITVESARNLYNADGILAGKSDPYVIVEVPGQEGMKFETPVISNDLNPVWNCTGEIAGFMDGDILQFTVMDKDTFPKPDDLLGKVSLVASDIYPNGLHSEIPLEESKTNATLSVMIVVLGCDELGMAGAIEENPAVAVAGEQNMQQMVEGGVFAGQPQTLHVNIMNARGLYNADGFLAGKSDPYCVCFIPGKEKFQLKTPTINNCLDPDWNFTGTISDFHPGDMLEFQVWDSDTFPNPDDLLGKVILSAQDFADHPEGLAGVLQLTGGKSQELGTLEVCIQVGSGAGAMTYSAAPAMTTAPGTVMMAAPAMTYSTASVPGQSCYTGSPMAYSSFPTSQPMVYGAPQSASMSMPMSQPSMTYSAPGTNSANVKQVIVHAPRTVTAEEFARTEGTIVSTPLPVTVETGIIETLERGIEKIGEKVVKKKKKSKGCC
jgi:hypothetical protein